MTFFGAVKGESGLYHNRVLMLGEEEVLPVGVSGTEVVFDDENSEYLGCVGYDTKRSEYLVCPGKKLSFFMESGQPLGAERLYYLPRGTKIYVKERTNSFELA